LNDAFIQFLELGEKYSETPLILNGAASAQMAMGNFAEAEKLLVNALGKNANDSQTLQNMVVVAQHMRKPPEVVNRYIAYAVSP